MAEAADIQGMKHSPARRWLGRSAAVAAGVPLLAGLLGGLAAPQATAAPSTGSTAATGATTASPASATAEPSGSSTVSVALDTLAPSAPKKGDTLTISGTVTNKSKKPVTDAQVDLRVGPQLVGRTAIDDADERSNDTTNDPPPVGGKYKVEFAKLASGISYDFALSVPVSKLALGGDGVYQLGVSLTGRTEAEPYDHTLGIRRTFLPWQPDSVDTKTKFTYLWPLISTSHVSAETGSDERQTPVFENDDLAEELAPGGRLEQLVSLGSQLPVTWVVDPDLLATVEAMADTYRVKDGNTTVAGTNQLVARTWLNSLEKAVQDNGNVVTLPFGDPDLASLAHGGDDVSGTLGHLQGSSEVAAKTVETILHVPPATDFAWPVDGAVDPSIVDVATSAGADKVISRSDSIQDNLPYTASAARPIGGGTTAVVADTRLSTAFEGDVSTAASSTLSVQKFLAQSLAVTLQDSSKQREIVVAPQRTPSAGQAQSMARALRGLDGERWTQSSDLVHAAAGKPDTNATTKVPRASRYPDKLRDQELPPSAFEELKRIDERLGKFKAILTLPDRVATPFANAVNRAVSTSWRGDATGAREYRHSVNRYLVSLASEVQLIQKSELTLSGRSATIPVTVQNQLLQGVDDLVLRLHSTNATRLKLDDGSAVAEQPIKVDGGHTQVVKFTGAANANGPVELTAQLYTTDGRPYGSPMAFQVRVSELTPTVMLVIAGGVLLLVLAGVRMYSQRKRAVAAKAAEDKATAEATAETGAGDAEEGADSAGSEPGQPSDPTPDTRPESGDPSGMGEKVDR
ncbi:DUF6049 family protein [Streptomyces sp. NBC_01716]|uniref:DUF6049 family protein n=1 Tax=Streptomyces sp. NBC_01716 TaxID=2975917 RepID=UPI002E2F7C34|nr:DUF6049 family protein [Streptomyces sp. NBC_01716]